MTNTDEAGLTEDISNFYADPLGFVKYAFSWNKKGTLLENESGPDDWQIETLKDIGHRIKIILSFALCLATQKGFNQKILRTPSSAVAIGTMARTLGPSR